MPFRAAWRRVAANLLYFGICAGYAGGHTEYGVLSTEYGVPSTLDFACRSAHFKPEGASHGCRARSFTELLFWQRVRKWSADIFRRTQREPFARDQRLVVQVNDSSESVMSNMAEGFGRGTQGEFVLFLGYALGSLDETQSHLCAAYDARI